ncbi:YopT-type cysteine protease domain-containing protein [Vitiosangium sp. GDMCC 1.1324]|uniref:YopT-type cysteine protease domain-containing protein n=1 Tax=Vitiosangium sp. (strain GDMCC 1.1324) TaxID=2138576 RepID=UPI00130D774A|nr:YopT-type cysteine protease domain-containing protein [Vitiosangium sp. GDMCC 1.1324]
MTFDPSKYKKFRVSNWGHSDPVYKKVATQQKVQGGVCRGMCLDWIRRILLGLGSPHEKNGMPVDKEKALKRYVKQIKLHDLLNEQASVPGYFENTLAPLAQKEDALLELKATCIAESNLYKQNGDDLKQRRLNGESIPPQELQAHIKMFNRVMSRMGYINKRLPQVQDDIRAIQAQTEDIEIYLNRKFPEMFANFQVAWKKHKPTNFQSITLDPPSTTQMTGSYTKGTDVWTKLVLPFLLLELEAGDCALVQAGVSSSNQPGHAIAFHLSHTGRLCFFDPNFGEFRFDPDEHSDMKVFFTDMWDWNYAQFTWVSLVRLRHSNGATSVAVYDPTVRKVKGSTSCNLM